METTQQYVTRLLSYIEGKDVLKILHSTPATIKKIIKKTEKKALYKKPIPTKWSVAEIIAHLAEDELVIGWRYRFIAEKDGVHIQSFNQDDWAKNSHYNKLNIHEMLELFTVLRKANVKFLKGLPKDKLKHFGMHEERGKEMLHHLIRKMAGHDINHLNQIKSILSPNHKQKKK